METIKQTNSLVVQNSKLSGCITLPSSKSQSLRAILFASLAKGKSTIYNVLNSPDVTCMIRACGLMGAHIERNNNELVIQGVGGKVFHFTDIVDAGNSGIILRFLTAIGALSDQPFVITGDYSIRYRRPMADMINALRKGGVQVDTLKGDFFAPLILKGPLKSEKIHLVGEDSQHVSALLIAATCRSIETTLVISKPGEKPWILLTLEWLSFLKIPFKARKDLSQITVYGKGSFSSFNYTVPGDLSTLAFPVAAALITKSKLRIKNVNLYDGQGDKLLFDTLKKMGACIQWDENQKTLSVDGNNTLNGISVNIEEYIDALPILAVIACFAKGKSKIVGISGARKKESDRVSVISKELQKMGAHIDEREDSIEIEGGELFGESLKSHKDHRIAMSLACAALGSKGRTVISDIMWIQKTYPEFINDFIELGAQMELV